MSASSFERQIMKYLQHSCRLAFWACSGTHSHSASCSCPSAAPAGGLSSKPFSLRSKDDRLQQLFIAAAQRVAISARAVMVSMLNQTPMHMACMYCMFP